ncbi:hypothetical protein HII31_03469 [Pseudocercospora fuligena]|uniref:Uncharacterized protein n=1 Tax=Pseudocercospora fuligena TaxID=685502 RepID=A0A8H6RQV9_9PEZI|nr:hypothetical protein HII31_03469 [Pseudocercospora fuligena]
MERASHTSFGPFVWPDDRSPTYHIKDVITVNWNYTHETCIEDIQGVQTCIHVVPRSTMCRSLKHDTAGRARHLYYFRKTHNLHQ